MLTRYEKFVQLVTLIETIFADTELTWEQKYELIRSDGLSSAVYETGVDISAYTPFTEDNTEEGYSAVLGLWLDALIEKKCVCLRVLEITKDIKIERGEE